MNGRDSPAAWPEFAVGATQTVPASCGAPCTAGLRCGQVPVLTLMQNVEVARRGAV